MDAISIKIKVIKNNLIERIGKKMETKLYVGNMSHQTTEQNLRTMFAEAGTVNMVEIIMDRVTGKPKGFAFVTMGSQEEGDKAISLFNEKSINEKLLKVNIAKAREERPVISKA